MNAPTNIQVINGLDGKPAFVVIPYDEYKATAERDLTPHAVVEKMILEDMTPARAWREHLGLTQTEVAERLGVSQSAFAQQENSTRLRKATREKIAAALGIDAGLLDV